MSQPIRLIDTPEGKRINQRCWLDTGAYARYFYPGRFNLDFDPQLKQIFDLIDAKVRMPNGQVVPKHNKINIISWRGRGKSTICKTLLAKRLRYNDIMFGVYIGKSFDFAALQTESVRRGMMQNKREIDLFGSLKPKGMTREMQETFSKKAWMTNTGALVWPRGCGQPVRGLLHDWDGASYRPSLIILDDLMDKQYIGSEKYRGDTYEWLLTDVAEAVPPPEMSMNWQVVFIDTLKHNDAVNQRLLDANDWKNVILPLAENRDGALRSNAPSFYTDKQVQDKYKHFDDIFKLDLFYQEFMCVATAGERAAFQPQMFKKYDENSDAFHKELDNGEIECVVLVDPAKTSNMSSDWSAVVGVGVNVRRNKFYVRDIRAGHFHPKQLYDEIFAMAGRLQPCHVIGIEVHSLHEFIKHPFMDEMHSRGLYYELVDLNPRRMPAESADRTHGKEGRVASLAPYYMKGCVYHNPMVCQVLEEQLLSFPHPRRWDVMDAFAYIVQIMEEGLRYFENQHTEDMYEDPHMAEREFAELSYDEPLGDDYRII